MQTWMSRSLKAFGVVAIGATALSAPASAQDKLTLWSHVVHQQVVEGARGGAEVDLGAAFTDSTGTGLEWVTIAFAQMADKVKRELNLSNSEADIVFVVNAWADPSTLRQLVPLDEFMAASPIANMDDISPAMIAAFSDKEGMKGIPIRHNPQLLHYNTQIFEQQGIEAAPTTAEELVETIKKATHVRDDGATVYGFAFETNQLEDLAVWVRAWGGELIGQDLSIGVNTPEAIAAISALRDLYAAGALPPNLSILTPADLQNLLSQGLIVMGIFGDNYYARFNNPEQSRVAGNTWFAPVPASESNTKADYASAAGVWAMTIPKNGDPESRQRAYDFMAYLSEQDNQLTLALNNNSPIRASIYSNAEYAAKVPYASVVQKVLPIAAPAKPAFPGSLEVERIILEEAVAAITGEKDVEAAVADADAAIERVMKREGLR